LVAYPGRGVYECARWGHVAEWLRNGLQNRVHQFNSGRGLQTTEFIWFLFLTSKVACPIPRAKLPLSD
jgi:hypothetical protein